VLGKKNEGEFVGEEMAWGHYSGTAMRAWWEKTTTDPWMESDEQLHGKLLLAIRMRLNTF
jgi:hypothetical protein